LETSRDHPIEPSPSSSPDPVDLSGNFVDSPLKPEYRGTSLSPIPNSISSSKRREQSIRIADGNLKVSSPETIAGVSTDSISTKQKENHHQHDTSNSIHSLHKIKKRSRISQHTPQYTQTHHPNGKVTIETPGNTPVSAQDQGSTAHFDAVRAPNPPFSSSFKHFCSFGSQGTA
jgi:hypothetical protein